MAMTEKEFITKWINKIKSELKEFPNDFVNDFNQNTIDMPSRNLLIAPPLFDNYEIIDSDGNIYFRTDNYFKAKYIVYSNRNRPKKISIPSDLSDVESAVKKYETYLFNILKEIEVDFKKEVLQSDVKAHQTKSEKNFEFVSNQIFSALNLTYLL